MTDTTMSSNGDIALNSGVGISVTPTGSGSAVGVISNVRAENNRQGIRADTSTTTGTITLTVRDSTASGSDQGGIAAASKIVGATTTAIMMYNVSSVNNGSGIIANGNTAIVRVGSSVLTGNTDAVTISNSGTVLSYKNNQIDGNTNNNTPIPQVNLN